MSRRILILFLVAIPISLWAKTSQPWLLSFPDISHDSKYAYFSGPKWTAIYLPPTGTMTTVPRDSLKMPSPDVATASAELWGVRYQCNGRALMSTERAGRDSTRVLPIPPREAIECLPVVGTLLPPADRLLEIMGPTTSGSGKIWFGLLLQDPVTEKSVGGIGWFDAALDRFGRLYSRELAGFRPAWIGVRSDSIYLVLDRFEDTLKVASRLVAVSIANGGMNQLNWSAEGVPGRIIAGAAMWGDTLLFSTERAVAVWKPNSKPSAWESRSYASPNGSWLYLKTFPEDDPEGGKLEKFLPLHSNTPTDILAQVGDWMEVVAPVGIEAYVNPDEWGYNSTIWTNWRWNCDTPCFAHLAVPMEGKMIDGDVTNVKLSYLTHDQHGVKIGFRAAWVKEDELAPVMMVPVFTKGME